MSNEREPGRVESEINEILARAPSASANAAPQGARDSLDRELRQIKEIIVRMGSLAEAAIRDRTLYARDHRVVHPDTGAVRWMRSAGYVYTRPHF